MTFPLIRTAAATPGDARGGANEDNVLVLAPLGRDSAIAVAILRDVNINAFACPTIGGMVRQFEQGVGCAIIAAEAILDVDMHSIALWLREQPTWSDLPLIVLTERGGGLEKNPAALRLMDLLGNVTFLERPFHAATLLSVVQTALRSRRRQYQAREQMAALLARKRELKDSEDKLRLLNETLEQQVAERTARLSLSEARLRAIFESSFHFQALVDREGRLVDANQTSLAAIGKTLPEIAGQKFWETPWFLAAEGVSDKIRDGVVAALNGEPVSMEINVLLPDGVRNLDLSIRPIRDEEDAIIAVVPEAADITVKRQAEDALRQAQKMEAIGQLTGGIAHDFNNLLQGIGGSVELMRKRIESGRPEQAGRHVDNALHIIGRAAALTHRLLAFSRRQALSPRTVSPGDLITGMAGLFRQTVGPAIDLKIDLAETSWPVTCDPNQLENALLNLAINARDAMAQAGGGLTIRTTHVTLSPHDIAGWSGAKPGHFVKISVTDTGCGIPDDIKQHVFEPFFTTKPIGEGTGLGLSQVFGFISQSRGIVKIESAPGSGTSVHLFLPRQTAEPDIETIPQPEAASGALAGSTVLLVEDEPAIRDLASETLRDLGCHVIEAGDGTAGLSELRALCAAPGAAIDILVTDFGLPGGLNGRQLADAARELVPNLPVLLITGYAGEALGPRGELLNGMELIKKPFALDALAARVEIMLSAKHQTNAH